MVEMQFADFVTCGFNQIVNNLAKLHWRWNEKADVGGAYAYRRWYRRGPVSFSVQRSLGLPIPPDSRKFIRVHRKMPRDYCWLHSKIRIRLCSLSTRDCTEAKAAWCPRVSTRPK
jgi:hypothetical protein